MLLLASDGHVVAVPDSLVPHSLLLSSLTACTRVAEPVPVLVARHPLGLVLQLLEHCTAHPVHTCESIEIRVVPQVVCILERLGIDQLGDVANTANYLGCTVLLELVCRFIAEKMQDRPLDELRAMFGAHSELGDGTRMCIEDAFGWVSSSDDS